MCGDNGSSGSGNGSDNDGGNGNGNSGGNERTGRRSVEMKEEARREDEGVGKRGFRGVGFV